MRVCRYMYLYSPTWDVRGGKCFLDWVTTCNPKNKCNEVAIGLPCIGSTFLFWLSLYIPNNGKIHVIRETSLRLVGYADTSLLLCLLLGLHIQCKSIFAAIALRRVGTCRVTALWLER